MAPETDVAGLAERLADGRLRCKVCQRSCVLSPDQSGFCRVRVHRGGRIVPLTYGRVAALCWAEVERKPLFHFYPGQIMLSVGSLGCNFRCPGCQNWELAHAEMEAALPDTEFISPADLVELAARRGPLMRGPCRGALGISWTYNEPAMWFEYTREGARLAKRRDLMTNYVTNGSITADALDAIGPFLDAYRVDIKGFSAETYRRVANFPDFRGILQVAERAKRRWGMHVECVTNVVPTLNDREEEWRGIARWIAEALSPDTPWHVTRFIPHHGLKHLPATEVRVLEAAREVGLSEGLKFVYIGNVPGHPAENTYCPQCGRIVVKRAGLAHPRVLLEGNACPACGTEIPGRFAPSAKSLQP